MRFQGVLDAYHPGRLRAEPAQPGRQDGTEGVAYPPVSGQSAAEQLIAEDQDRGGGSPHHQCVVAARRGQADQAGRHRGTGREQLLAGPRLLTPVPPLPLVAVSGCSQLRTPGFHFLVHENYFPNVLGFRLPSVH